MIFEWLLLAVQDIVGWWLTMLPDADVLGDGLFVDNLLGLVNLVGSMGVWVNWSLVAAQVSLVLGIYFTALTLRCLRALIGHIPQIGGNG